MGQLQAAVDSFPAWKAILWCFYPLATLVVFELLSSNINDDDDNDGGHMIPALQASNN